MASVAAQVLLVPHDFVDRRQYLHARQTLVRLLELGCVPIINENDAIASDEIRYGDNDRIAALVAHNVAADVLVLLTDTDGLYTADPRTDPTAQLVARGRRRRPAARRRRRPRPAANRGSGGMASKLAGGTDRLVVGCAGGDRRRRRDPTCWSTRSTDLGVGTTFLPNDRKLSARKLWIGFASQRRGRGRRRRRRPPGAGRAWHVAAARPASSTCVGDFDEGDVVEVRDLDGSVRRPRHGAVRRRRAAAIMGRRTADLPAEIAHEVIHRDDLVLLA